MSTIYEAFTLIFETFSSFEGKIKDDQIFYYAAIACERNIWWALCHICENQKPQNKWGYIIFSTNNST